MIVVYAPRALRDLDAIEHFLKQRSEVGTRNVLATIKRAIGDLERFPRIGIPIDADGRYRMPVARYPYLIFYRLNGDTVYILHIRHAARVPVGPAEL